MKILQISNKIPFKAKDGGALAMYNLLEGFLFNNIDIHVLSMNTSRHYIDQAKIFEMIPDKIKFDLVRIDTNVKMFKLLINFIFSKKPYILQRFISKSFHEKLRLILSENEFDIIHLEGLYVCPYIKIIRKFSKALIAYRSHNIESLIWENNASYEKNPFKRFYLHKLSKRIREYELSVINQYDLLVPISTGDLEFFIQNGNKKPFCVIPYGVFPERYLFSEKKNEAIKVSVFYIGSLDWIPNIDGLRWFILNVWSVIKKKYPDLVFKIAGRNADHKIIKLFHKNQVEFLGEIEDSNTLFLDNSIMIVPLFSGSGMRVKIIEGMAFGKTIVSTLKGAEGIGCNHGDNILIANTIDEFLFNLNDIIQHKEKCNLIGKNARNLVKKKYNNNFINKELIAFYEQRLS